MLSQQLHDALSTLVASIEAQPEVEAQLAARWRAATPGATVDEAAGEVGADLGAAADLVDKTLPALTRSQNGLNDLVALFGKPEGEVVLAWCAATAARRDTRVARLLAPTMSRPELGERAGAAARARIVEGPLLDALACAPILGSGDQFALAQNAEAAARMEILIWEAGASALGVPELGPWIFGSEETFEAMIGNPAHGTLRHRVIAARCLEVSVRGMPKAADPQLVGRTLQILQPLLLHPEPLVWVHAARALGGLAGSIEYLEGTLLDWVRGESQVLRQRAMTAFASLPAERLKFLASELVSLLDSPEEAWALAAIAAATPYLFFERRDLWDRLAARILEGDGGAVAARALARGLATLWRRGVRQVAIETPIRQLRELARRARAHSIDEWRRWLDVISVTDPIDDAERDPLDHELGVENLVRIAAQYDDEEADARAARFADTLSPTFLEARRIALGGGSLRHRAAAINAWEGCARSLALSLWEPLLATRPMGTPVEIPDLREAWKVVARTPSEVLDLVAERRQSGAPDDQLVPLEVLALRLGGYALDACGDDDSNLGNGRGPTAHDTCLLLRKLDGLSEGTRKMPPTLETALGALFWRLVDTTRGTALGEVDDVEWLGPFAAWWSLVIDQPDILQELTTALPMLSKAALAKCCEKADEIRTAVSLGEEDGAWGAAAHDALVALHAEHTELAHALVGLAKGLEKFASASGTRPDLEAMCLDLALAAERLHGALADPVKALHQASEQSAEDSLRRGATENTPRVAGLVARAIRARELSLLEVWFTSLGPVTSSLVEAAVEKAVRRTPPPPPKPKKVEAKLIEGYELIKPLGEGGIGSVWLVRKPGADRLFVLKIPKAEALAGANEVERAGILASFVDEAKALAGLYHPNVANIIDRGISDSVPFLVLEYLIGADLKQYSHARLMSLFELRQVVVESCAGLAALHNAGLVHRDIKPANLWLRLPLQGGELFDPAKHRDPARVHPLNSVVIDFGMVRAMRVGADAAGRFVAGTPGYIAPEQVLDPVELDPRADVYALAGTIYAVTSGRTFFDDIDNQRDRVIAHMRRDPFEDAERGRAYPAAILKLLRAATARNAADRPAPIEFGKEFAAAL
ncbi:MAG: serine/threonine-protein kinase [Polyangiaceae bacterium]